jgi:eukaryotic-like serine/threonine-protein kinase
VNGSASAQTLVGAVLNGRYRLVRLLGEGGMGAVYEADNLQGQGKRAIKLLHPEFMKEDQILQRFFAEAQTTRNLNHPNIAQVTDSATAEDGSPYLVMELLQGIPLSSYIDQGNPIPPQHAVPIVYGVLQALTAAHAEGVIHRDLKPDNLFLIRDANGNSQVKVLDFGIAKVMDVAGGMGQKTRTGVLLGTPGYMSPEQIKNSKGVDGRTDLWSLGVIFYEMLTSKQPFPADNEFARLTSVLTEEVKPIEQVMPQLAAWGPFFRRALAKDPAQRFQSAEEMAQAMNAVARGLSMPAPAPAPSAAAPRVGQHGTVPVMPQYPAPAPSGHAPSVTPPPAGQRYPEQSAVAAQYARPLEQSAVAAQYARPLEQSAVAAQYARPPEQSAVAAQYARPPEQSAVAAQYAPQSFQGAAHSAGGVPSMPARASHAPHSPPSAALMGGAPPPSAASMGMGGHPHPGRLHPAGPAGFVGPSPTQFSPQQPPGTPTLMGGEPVVEVVTAAPLARGGAAWWVVGVVGLVAFGLGLAVGLLAGG